MFDLPTTQTKSVLNLRPLWHAVLFLLFYVLGAEFGHVLSFPNHFASFWPPSGVYFVALFMNRIQRWPMFLVTALLGNTISDVGFHSKTIPISLGFWLANTLEAVVGAYLLRRTIGHSFHLTRLRSTLWFVASTVCAGTVVGASVGAAVVVRAFGGTYPSVWLTWWMSSVIGILLVAPVAMSIQAYSARGDSQRPRSLFEICAFLIAAAVIAEFVFGWQSRPIAFTVLPFVFGASLRLRLTGAVITTNVISVIAVWHSIHVRGPFIGDYSLVEQMLLTQGFLVVTIIVSLLLAAMMQEQKVAVREAETMRNELMKANVQLHVLASTDTLTQLQNRGSFETHLAQEIVRAARNQTSASLILIDVDQFKRFNDEFGHPAGDQVLKTVAELLKQSVRKSDFVARYGGEEFAILLANTDQHMASEIAERCRTSIETGVWHTRPITISVGVSTLADGDIDGEQLIAHADAALYRSKRQGRNMVSLANELSNVDSRRS